MPSYRMVALLMTLSDPLSTFKPFVQQHDVTWVFSDSWGFLFFSVFDKNWHCAGWITWGYVVCTVKVSLRKLSHCWSCSYYMYAWCYHAKPAVSRCQRKVYITLRFWAYLLLIKLQLCCLLVVNTCGLNVMHWIFYFLKFQHFCYNFFYLNKNWWHNNLCGVTACDNHFSVAELYDEIGNFCVKSLHYVHIVGSFSGLVWCTGLVYHRTASKDNLQLFSCTTCFWNSLLFSILCFSEAFLADYCNWCVYISAFIITTSIVVQGICGQNGPNPKQIATVLISFVSCTMGSPPPRKKSPRDSEWRFSNYQWSKFKVSQSETRIQKWANKRCTYRVWCQFIGNRP